VKNMKQHPIKQMLALGLKATVNSDDPAFFGGYVGDNFAAIAETLSLSRADLATLARNSFAGSFLGDSEQRRHLAEIDAVHGDSK